MAEYKLEVTTGDLKYSGTWDHVYVTLIGDEGESERTELDNYGLDFTTGTLKEVLIHPTGDIIETVIKTPKSLGKLLLIKLEKEAYFLLPEDEWYCSKVVVKTPEGDSLLFPCYNWISRRESLALRGGNAVKVFEEDDPLLMEHRKNELTQKKKTFGWRETDDGVPHYSPLEVHELPSEIRVTSLKSSEISHTKMLTGFELKIKGLLKSDSRWENIDDMKKIFWCERTPLSEYVAEHWKDDEFFGYQFLNATNPMVIKRCLKIPPNFSVTEEMVKPFLREGSSLQKELKEGNMFIVDHKRMEGIVTRLHNGQRLHVVDGFCLFYLNPDKKLKPIAIQLYQQPSEKNPVFLPSDSDTDWTLAKMFIKNSDAMDHEIVHHLMNTHYLAEVYTISTLRNLPVIHPLYKLLIPHFRGTLHVNAGGRIALLGPGGPLTITSLGFDGTIELMKRSHPENTYSSMCPPENIPARGLESIPNYYYRDDGLRLWDIVNSFVKAVIEHFYTSDDEVQKDAELQDWIREIFVHGFLSKESSGIPNRFNTVEEVIKFVTMVVFNVSVQHVAVNGGQFDYLTFIPNGSLLLHKPPPSSKGESTMKSILETLPTVGETVKFAALFRLLSEKYTDFVPLGKYPEERFNEPEVKRMIEEFQAELSQFSEVVDTRNKQLDVPYTYLNPTNIENSTAI